MCGVLTCALPVWKIKKQDAWRDIVMLTDEITDVAAQVQTGPGYVVPVQSYVRCRISGQIFAILAAEIVRHVDIAVKHDISFGKLEGQHPVQAHRAEIGRAHV